MKKVNYRRLIPVILFVAVFGMLFRSNLFTSYVVDGKSMEPTLHDGNLLMVNKIAYDLKDVVRFDVIVFHANTKDDYVKRVIGLPGDEIVYKQDKLYVNGEYVQERFLHSLKVGSTHEPFTNDFTLMEITGHKKVPEGKLFVMGDNRPDSLDSRSFGFISIEQLVGKVDVKYWPLS
ncbi:signal peptidase I [Virgibacillus alimentarius]|uniref:Signal peptidase I n=1 Tax=Virgibacillus alimentarius TaxID=698769 RepID=A0ABS4SA65_9BACI|nr:MULTISPECIES: signal peptidase I [Virgibacillus]MBP2258227.1 signal peptidase I [Virgibacillus alimentarius]HLR65789.1 signal peptidase I [Virgibacillus sp.]